MYPQYTIPQHHIPRYAIPVFQVGGAAFTNQPANDGVEVVSNNAGDTGKMTIWGTTHTTGALTYETITLNGTSVVSTTKTDWGNIYGVFLGDIYGKNTTVAVGTITVREASGDATITTVAAGKRSIGTQIFQIDGNNVTFHNISGNSYLNGRVFPTTNNSFQFTAGMSMDVRTLGKVPNGFDTTNPNGTVEYLYVLGDTTGSTAQIQIWED